MAERLAQTPNEITQLATLVSTDIRERGSRNFQQVVTSAWKEFTPMLVEEHGEVVSAPSDKILDFMVKTKSANNSIRDRDLFGKLISLDPNLPDSGEFKSLLGLISHDISHIHPSQWLFGVLQHAYSFKKDGRSPFLKDWIGFLDEAINRAEELANTQALVVDYVGAVANLDRHQEVFSAPFPILQTMEKIGYLLKGRFYHDDYELLVNPKELPKPTRNRIIIRADESLVLNASEAILFCDIYNLVKNSCKAVWEKFDKQGHPSTEFAIDRRLRGEPFPGEPSTIVMTATKTEDSLVLTVDDTGVGLSLDKALERVHDIIEGIKAGGKDVSDSKWYASMVELGLREDADLFIAWPRDPKAIRLVRVGTLCDTFFSAAFEDFGWGGFSSTTSNFGLWGISYLTNKLQGTVMGTNKFDGGALFTIVLPKSSVGL